MEPRLNCYCVLYTQTNACQLPYIYCDLLARPRRIDGRRSRSYTGASGVLRTAGVTREGSVFKVVTTQDELLKAFCVRSIVFIEEQTCSYAIEHDELDYSAVHVLGEDGGEPFAAGRIRFFGEYAKLERIAVRKRWRERGLGHELVEFMIARAEELGFKRLKMHAQAYLCEFYRRHGFEIHGEMFQEANIDHYAMYRNG